MHAWPLLLLLLLLLLLVQTYRLVVIDYEVVCTSIASSIYVYKGRLWLLKV